MSQEVSCPPTEVNSDPQRFLAMVEAVRARHSEPDSTESIVQDILKIIPLNTEARRAFDSVAQSIKDGSLDPLHAQYVCITGQRPLGPMNDTANVSDETEEEPSIEPPTMLWTGYYRLNFAQAAVSSAPTWVIGRGSGQKFGAQRNIDIILIAPGTKGFKGLAAAHVYLAIHPISGAWQLTAGSEIQVEDACYNAREKFYFSQPKTRIQILEMQYLILFEINSPCLESDYIRERNDMLQKRHQDSVLPHTTISGIPMQGDLVFDSICFRQGIASGSFGCVYEGFAPENGNLRVAKRIILKSAREAPDVFREIQALEQFRNCVGIIDLVDWRTSLNGKDLSVAYYPLDVYLVHEKGVAFNKLDWSTIPWDIKRSLCYQLLAGLKLIHGAQCMHRDITPTNILVFPYQDPPQATLCDFGKFCSTPTDVETRLAGWQFLPPELEKDRKNQYNQTLDIWMLGLALSYCWWPMTKDYKPRERLDYKSIQLLVRQARTTDHLLGDLIADMMAWKPQERPSAVDALEHKSLQRFTKAEGAKDLAPTTKRSHGALD